MDLHPSPRGIYHALYDYRGDDAYREVVRPWADEHGSWFADLLAPLAVHGAWRRVEYAFGDLLEQAYALSRLSDVMLLAAQPPLAPEMEQPWAHELHLGRLWPPFRLDDYEATFAALGMTTTGDLPFDPFFHEIAAVEQATDPDEPISVVETVWPGLMLGEMLFSRSGVRVRAGTGHAAAGVADRSTLYDVFLRRHRPTSDLSLGWGHNSQWKTDFRRDYVTTDAYHLNVDADVSLDDLAADPDDGSIADYRELLRHRCALTAPDVDRWPSEYRLTVPRA